MAKLFVVLVLVVGCSQVDVQDPGEYLDKLHAVCALAPVVEGVPKQVTEACAVIQRVRIEVE